LIDGLIIVGKRERLLSDEDAFDNFVINNVSDEDGKEILRYLLRENNITIENDFDINVLNGVFRKGTREIRLNPGQQQYYKSLIDRWINCTCSYLVKTVKKVWNFQKMIFHF